MGRGLDKILNLFLLYTFGRFLFFWGGGTSLFLLARFFFLRLRAFRVGALERRVAAANPSPSFFLSVCVDVVDVVAAGIAVVAVNVLRLIVEVTM